MKKLMFFNAILLTAIALSYGQNVRNYINIANSEDINNPQSKNGWTLNFWDEFNQFNNTTPLSTWNPNQPDALPNVYKNDYIQINPTNPNTHGGGWNWFWASHHWPGQAFYHTFENVVDSSDNITPDPDFPSYIPKYVSLKANHNDIAKADVPLDPGFNSMFPMKHNYSVSMLMSSDKEHMYLYGYFEIRSRLPKAKYTWPGFWLRGNNEQIDDSDQIVT